MSSLVRKQKTRIHLRRAKMDNYFTELNKIDVNDKTEKKGNLTYLSWAWAWGELKKRHPDAFYTIYENADGLFYHHDGRTAWVKTGVTVNGIEHIEYLPVMDYKNNSITIDRITSTDVNKTIQRSLTKAVARHGLGLYIYAGEDLPDGNEAEVEKIKGTKISETKVKALQSKIDADGIDVGKLLKLYKVKSISDLNEEQLSQIVNSWSTEIVPKCKE